MGRLPRLLSVACCLAAVAACSRGGTQGRNEAPGDRGWVRTGSALSTNLRRPTPLTVAPPDTDSRDNGTARAGDIAPKGGQSSGGQAPNGGGISSTGGPG